LAVERRSIKLTNDPLVAIHHLQTIVGVDPAAEPPKSNRIAVDEKVGYLLGLQADATTCIEWHCRARILASAIDHLAWRR